MFTPRSIVSTSALALTIGALGLGLARPAAAAPEHEIDWPDPPARAAAAEASDAPPKGPAKARPKAKPPRPRTPKPSARALREAEAQAEAEREREALRAATQEESARAHREAARARGDDLVAAGRPREAAREVAVVAAVDGDPLLFLAAAEASLAAVSRRDRQGSDALALARGHVAAARDALAVLRDDPGGLARLGLDADTLPAIDAHIDQVRAAIDRHSGAQQRRRVAVGELASGAALTAIGLSGLGVMSGGLYLDRAADAELARAGVDDVAGLSPDLQPAVRGQLERASTMIAVGSIVGATGLALGVTLTTIGARDLKRVGGVRRRRASLQAAPTLGGLILSGRF